MELEQFAEAEIKFAEAEIKFSGWRPRTAQYSFVMPQKSTQKKAPVRLVH
jgi:hypothetical protein